MVQGNQILELKSNENLLESQQKYYILMSNSLKDGYVTVYKTLTVFII